MAMGITINFTGLFLLNVVTRNFNIIYVTCTILLLDRAALESSSYFFK